MRKFFKITKAIIMKAATAILLAALTVFNIALKIFTTVFRWLTIPVIFFGLIIAVVTYFDHGYSPTLLHAMAVFATMGILYFLLPLIPELVFCAQLRMKAYVLSPIIIHSPVKFTL